MIPADEAWPDALEHASAGTSVREAEAGADRVGRLRKAATAFRTISEVADELHVPQHVLRFWETRFPQVKPLKRGGGRRYYRPDDVVLLRRISDLLYIQGYTIKGVQRLLTEGDGGPHGDPARPEPGDVADHGEPHDRTDTEEQPDTLHRKDGGDDPPEDHQAGPHDELRGLREAFRETLGLILSELEAIRRQLPN